MSNIHHVITDPPYDDQTHSRGGSVIRYDGGPDIAKIPFEPPVMIIIASRDHRVFFSTSTKQYEVQEYNNGWITVEHFQYRPDAVQRYECLVREHDRGVRSELSTGTVQFIQGSPYVSCGWCNVPVKQFDGTQQKITILIDWIEDEPEYYIDKDTGLPTVKEHWIPLFKQTPGCFECWNRTTYIKGSYYSIPDKGLVHPRKTVETPNQTVSTTIYRNPEEYTVVWTGKTPLTVGGDHNLYGKIAPYKELRKETKR